MSVSETSPRDVREGERHHRDRSLGLLRIDRTSILPDLAYARIRLPEGRVHIEQHAAPEPPRLVEQIVVFRHTEGELVHDRHATRAKKIGSDALSLDVVEAQGRVDRTLTLSVPEDRELDCEVYLGEGDVSLQGGRGTSIIHIDHGDVRVSKREGDTLLTSENGSVTVDGYRGQLLAVAGQGDISVADSAFEGSSLVMVGKGDIKVENMKNNAIHIEAAAPAGTIAARGRHVIPQHLEMLGGKNALTRLVGYVGEKSAPDRLLLATEGGDIIFSAQHLPQQGNRVR